MKPADQKRPDVALYLPLFIIPTIGIGLVLSLLFLVAIDHNVHLNYGLAVWVVSISGSLLFLLTLRVWWIAAVYVWEYFALVQYLRARGLQSFVDEAQKIKRLPK